MSIDLAVAPADADNFAAAVHIACDTYSLDRHDAVELVAIVYERGIVGDECVNDVIDRVQDANPDLESWEFVPDVARVFGYRAD